MKWVGPYGMLPPGREGVIVREGDTLMSYSWPRGSYVYLDGGTLELGIWRAAPVRWQDIARAVLQPGRWHRIPQLVHAWRRG